MKSVDKVWGKETWIINCKEYCGKILELNAGYCSSTHYHKIKQETFYCLEGRFTLGVENEVYHLDSTSEPVTILPRQKHFFRAKESARMLEVSTTHNEEDVYRENESHKLPSFCFDMDGVICSNGNYKKAVPDYDIIEKINNLYSMDMKILIWTARGTETGTDWTRLTEKQLKDWGVEYDELVLGKPEADLFIDDRAINVKDWCK